MPPNGNTDYERVCIVVNSFFSIGMIPLNVLMYGNVPRNRFEYAHLNRLNQDFYIPYSGIAEGMLLNLTFFVGGLGLQLAFPRTIGPKTDWVYEQLEYVSAINTFGIILGVIITISVYCPSAFYNEMSDGYLWGCAIFQPLTGFVIGYFIATIFKLKFDKKVTLGLTTSFQNMQFSLATLINDYQEKPIFTNIVIYPIMVHICQIFWFSLLFISLRWGDKTFPPKSYLRTWCRVNTVCCQNEEPQEVLQLIEKQDREKLEEMKIIPYDLKIVQPSKINKFE